MRQPAYLTSMVTFTTICVKYLLLLHITLSIPLASEINILRYTHNFFNSSKLYSICSIINFTLFNRCNPMCSSEEYEFSSSQPQHIRFFWHSKKHKHFLPSPHTTGAEAK
jgi:hypothetical protein